MRRPSKGLDSSLMIRQFEARRGSRRSGNVPQAELVVVSTAGKSIALLVPLKTTDFLSMRVHCGYLVLCDANVMIHDASVSTSAGNNVAVPSECADAFGMAVHGTKLLGGVNVP